MQVNKTTDIHLAEHYMVQRFCWRNHPKDGSLSLKKKEKIKKKSTPPHFEKSKKLAFVWSVSVSDLTM